MANPRVQIDFGKRIRALREAKGHSQEAFSSLANIDRSAYGKLERGEINVGLVSIARIAVALDMQLSDLLASIELDHNEIHAIPRAARRPKIVGSRD